MYHGEAIAICCYVSIYPAPAFSQTRTGPIPQYAAAVVLPSSLRKTAAASFSRRAAPISWDSGSECFAIHCEFQRQGTGVRENAEIIQDCLSGSQAAWDQLVERFGRLVYSIPRRYGLSAADADDVFQSVFAHLFRNLGTLRDAARLSSWLITTAHRECWRVGKGSDKYSHLDTVIQDVSEPSAHDAERWEQQQLVRDGVKELGGRCEELLFALFLDPAEPDYEAVSAKLNIPIGSIGPTRARCFEKLQKILQKKGL